MAPDVATDLRSLRGQEVRLTLRPEPAELSGQVKGLLESADGLVVYILDAAGKVHTVHSHLITDVIATGSAA